LNSRVANDECDSIWKDAVAVIEVLPGHIPVAPKYKSTLLALVSHSRNM